MSQIDSFTYCLAQVLRLSSNHDGTILAVGPPPGFQQPYPVAYSTDRGASWTVITSVTGGVVGDIIYEEGYGFCTVGSAATSPFEQVVYTSPDGITWTLRGTGPAAFQSTGIAGKNEVYG